MRRAAVAFAVALWAFVVVAAGAGEPTTFVELDSSVDATSSLGDNPSYTLPYPAVTYASHQAGGFFHPMSTVNPLTAPWTNYAPVVSSSPHWAYSSASALHSPVSAYLHGYVQPHWAAPGFAATALGLNNGLFIPGGDTSQAKGGYNAHGLTAGNVFGGFHAGLSADLESLGGKANEQFLETHSTTTPSTNEALHESDRDLALIEDEDFDMTSNKDEQPYGLYPAPSPAAKWHFVRSRKPHAAIGPHKLQFAEVGENQVDESFPALVEVDAEAEAEAETEVSEGCVNCAYN